MKQTKSLFVEKNIFFISRMNKNKKFLEAN